MLQACAMGRPNHLIRTHPPEHTYAAAAWFDAQISATLQLFLGPDVVVADIPSLPIRRGGLGFRQITEIAGIAYEASITDSKGQQREVTDEFDQLKEQGILASMSESHRAMFASFQKSCQTISSSRVCPSDAALKNHIRERLFLSTAKGKCRCEEELTTGHVYTCHKFSGQWIMRHDMIKQVLAAGSVAVLTPTAVVLGQGEISV